MRMGQARGKMGWLQGSVLSCLRQTAVVVSEMNIILAPERHGTVTFAVRHACGSTAKRLTIGLTKLIVLYRSETGHEAKTTNQIFLVEWVTKTLLHEETQSLKQSYSLISARMRWHGSVLGTYLFETYLSFITDSLVIRLVLVNQVCERESKGKGCESNELSLVD